MGYEPELGERVEQIREASTNLAYGDARTNKRIDELAASINGLYLKHGRPGREIADDDTVSERKSVLVKSLLSAAKVGASTFTHSRAICTSASASLRLKLLKLFALPPTASLRPRNIRRN